MWSGDTCIACSHVRYTVGSITSRYCLGYREKPYKHTQTRILAGLHAAKHRVLCLPILLRIPRSSADFWPSSEYPEAFVVLRNLSMWMLGSHFQVRPYLTVHNHACINSRFVACWSRVFVIYKFRILNSSITVHFKVGLPGCNVMWTPCLKMEAVCSN
jgi:hypothetical protein